MTDSYIAARIVEQLTGQPPDSDQVKRLVQGYIDRLDAELKRREGFLIDPVSELLPALHDHPGFRQFLLTGNNAAGAAVKLSHFGVDHFFDFSLSAFGDDQHERNEIASAALDKIRRHFPETRPEEIYVIGDTPNDIRCGLSIGARTIAVATGRHSVEELASHSPWWAVGRLPAPDAFIAKLHCD